MYRRILVPLDGTLAEEQVLKHACMLARNDNAQLVLLRVLAVRTPDPLLTPPWTLAAAAQELDSLKLLAGGSLERLAERLRAMQLRVNIRVEAGQPVDAILAAARAEQADVIVMSADGLRGRDPWPDGDVTTQVMRRARVPVFLAAGGRDTPDSVDSSEQATLSD